MKTFAEAVILQSRKLLRLFLSVAVTCWLLKTEANLVFLFGIE
jgi:hypothetical protein